MGLVCARTILRYGGEVRGAFRGFMNNSSPENVLVLMDLKDQDLKDAVTKKEEIWTSPAIRCFAGQQGKSGNVSTAKSWNHCKIAHWASARV